MSSVRVFWSAEDGQWVAVCSEFPSLSWIDKDKHEAVKGMERLLAEVDEDES